MFGMTSGADWLIAGLGNPEPKYDAPATMPGLKRWTICRTVALRHRQGQMAGAVRHGAGGDHKSCCSSR